MKKTIIAASLIIISFTSCMETGIQWDIFKYLYLHEIPRIGQTKNPCEEVKKLVTIQTVDINKKETNCISFYKGWTPLEIAIKNAKCPQCANLLKKHGAQETDRSKFWQEDYQYKINEEIMKIDS